MRMEHIESLTRGILSAVVKFGIDYYNNNADRKQLYNVELPMLLQSVTDYADAIIEDIRGSERDRSAEEERHHVFGITLDKEDELYALYDCIDDR